MTMNPNAWTAAALLAGLWGFRGPDPFRRHARAVAARWALLAWCLDELVNGQGAVEAVAVARVWNRATTTGARMMIREVWPELADRLDALEANVGPVVLV